MNVQVALFPCRSLVVMLTTVVPIGNIDPDTGMAIGGVVKLELSPITGGGQLALVRKPPRV